MSESLITIIASDRQRTPSPTGSLVRAVLACLVVLFASGVAAAQATFTVTLVFKTAAHPYYGQGFSEGYAIDGVEGATLRLERGQTYSFQMENVPSYHPFYLSTDAAGLGQGAWNEGVVGNYAWGNQVLTFTVPSGAPDELWYQCLFHGQMGWKMLISNASSTEDGTDGYSLLLTSANPAQDRFEIEVSLGEAARAIVEVLAVDGRRVALLHDGPMTAHIGHRMEVDGSKLSSGIYTIRVAAGAWSAERRVTLAR